MTEPTKDNQPTPPNPADLPADPAPPLPESAQKHSFGKNLWMFARIMSVRIRFILLMVIVGLVVGYWEDITNHYDRWRRSMGGVEVSAAQDVEYYCGMHPSVIRSEPGNCPICGMPLIKRARTVRPPLPEGVLAQVQLTPQKMTMGRIGVSPVEYRLLARETRATGVVDYDESRRAVIAARVKGRLDKLLVNYTGQKVKQGDALALIYSPDLLVAQEELLTAVKARSEQKSPGGLDDDMSQSLVDSARKKLLLWGLSEQQVADIIQRGKVETHVTVFSPIAGTIIERKATEGKYVVEGDELYTVADLSNVWTQIKVFESDIAGIKPDTAVQVTNVAYPEELFAGRIDFVAPTLESATRTIPVRVKIANPDDKLKPGMYITAVIRLPAGKVTPLTTVELAAVEQAASQPATQMAMQEVEYFCEMHPEIIRSAPGNCPICGMILTKRTKVASSSQPADARFVVGYYCPIYPDRVFDVPGHCPIDKFPLKQARVEKVLAVPESAVIDTGTRKVAYRQSAVGVFDLVELQLGPRSGGFYPVISGLNQGDQVATAGAFLVDAENRLNPAANAQYFGASGGPSAGGSPSGGSPPAGGHQH